MELVTVVFIAAATFITRIINLLTIPIFTDEAIYIRWAQIGLADPAHRYISLTDGKQPLFTWLMYPFLRIFSDPLFAGRFVSVVAGVLAVVGIYFLSREFFGKKTAFIAALLYIFSPFAFVYDRLALYDSLLAAIGIWSLYLTILLVTKIRLDIALLLGLTIGAGVLTKSSAWSYLAVIPISLMLFNFKVKEKVKKLVTWFSFFGISFFLAQIMYNSLRLSPWFYLIRQKNYSFVMTYGEFIKKPFETFWPNLYGLVSILITYLTIPVFLLVCYGIFLALLKKDKKIFYLFSWFAIPFVLEAAIAKVIFPRFILFMVMPLLVIAAYAIYDFFKRLRNKKLTGLIIILILLYPVYQSLILMFSPVNAAIPQTDRNQLFDEWPSGYGVNEVISYIRDKAKTGKVVLGTEGTFGLNPAVYEIYLKNNPNIDIRGYWPVGEVPKDLLEAAKSYPTYLVFKESQKIPENWPLKLIAKYRRGKGNTYLLFYQVESRDKSG